MRKFLLTGALICFFMCPAFFLASFLPWTLNLLEPLMCPDGMQLTMETRYESDLRGNVISSNPVCVSEEGQSVDVTVKFLVALYGFPILGLVLLALWTLTKVTPISRETGQDTVLD